MNQLHGGDIYGYEKRFGRRPIDFSASLSPLGTPPAVCDALRRAAGTACAYPDPLCRELVAALARHRGVPESFIFCGNGAAEILHRLALALRPETSLLVSPTFAEYERALSLAQSQIRYHPLLAEKGFVLDESVLDAIDSGVGMFVLCQPNNPTGRLADPDFVGSLVRRCAETGTTMLVDECFLHFTDMPDRHSLVNQTERWPHLIVLDSFTKIYGMAGVRLGYCVSSDPSVLSRLASAGPPWSVSTAAQAAGLAALDEREYIDETRRVLFQEKPKLIRGLRGLGYDVIGADANFIFFHAGTPHLAERLANKGYLIRDCRTFHGLEPGYYRVAVAQEEENNALLRAMTECGE